MSDNGNGKSERQTVTQADVGSANALLGEGGARSLSDVKTRAGEIAAHVLDKILKIAEDPAVQKIALQIILTALQARTRELTPGDGGAA